MNGDQARKQEQDEADDQRSHRNEVNNGLVSSGSQNFMVGGGGIRHGFGLLKIYYMVLGAYLNVLKVPVY